MKEIIPTSWFGKGRFGIGWIVSFVFLLLALSLGAEYALLSYYETNWEAVVEEECARDLGAAEAAFTAFQRTTRRVATEVAQHPAVVSFLSGQQRDMDGLFAYISRVSAEQDVGVEVYDREGVLVGWEGRSGPSHRRDVLLALAGQLTSYVTRGTIFSQLFVATPVRREGAVIGIVLVRRTIEVNYPITSRLIDPQGLADELSRDLGVSVEFDFSPEAEFRKDGRYVSAFLYGIDSSRVGVVSILRPARSASLEGVAGGFHRMRAVLLTVLIGLAVVVAVRKFPRTDSILAQSIALTAVIWLARFGLLWVEMPSIFLTSGIFDPVHYASKFGGGLAKSVGELAITVAALLVHTLLVARLIISRQSLTSRSPWWYPGIGAVRIAAALLSAAFLFLLLRGYGASIRGAVFDSTLKYHDPRVIIPSFELAMMVWNLFILSFCLIVVGVGVTSFLVTLFSAKGRTPVSNLPWWGVAVLFGLSAVLFGILHPNPLVTLWYRIFFGIGVLGFTFHLHRRARGGAPVLTVGNFLIALGLSAVFFYPLLDQMIHEKDRERVRVFAGEVLRPVDSWLKLVVDESLKNLAGEDAVRILRRGDAQEIDRLAFTRWAGSTVSREGYSCYFAVADTNGQIVSQFTIGGQTSLSSQLRAPWKPPSATSVQVHEIGSGVHAVKLYTGSVPIRSDEGDLVGYGLVIVAASQQALFRGETPAILRSASQESIESFYRPVVVSEFRDGALLTSTNTLLPLSFTLPSGVMDRLGGQPGSSVWREEVFGGRTFETLYVRASPQRVIALSLPELDLVWHLFHVVKVIVYYGLVVLLVLAGYLTLQWARGRRYRFTFRDRLLVALVLTALVPIVVIASYIRTFAQERLMESIARRLEQETTTVGVNILPRLPAEGEASSTALSPYFAEQLAADLGTDFNLYLGRELVVSSRPELYEAGILDKRISGSAYAHVMIRGKRFHVEMEEIGTFRYAVGYRPLVTPGGTVAAIVSVPTLYRLDEVEEEVSRQNAFIFGVYALVLFAILIIATTVANRIAAPIHKLTEATRRVSRGDLNVRLQGEHVDGEIGELVRSFQTMTEDLQRSREELIRIERELAWKEMAKQVAHEIKNPLTPMKLQIQHLVHIYRERGTDFDRLFHEVSRTLMQQIDTLSRIASEFSHYARMPKPQFEPYDVNAILRESVRLFEQESRLEMVLQLEPDLPPILADREELRRAFINIIRNGMQAMNNNGRIVIGSRRGPGGIILTFRDFGPGIPEEIRDKLFQPNFSTKTEGMGLGLAIVRKTVDDLGGTITIESASGGGTLVTITVPVHDPVGNGTSSTHDAR